MKKIPYGESDFRKIKLENFYYIDKTHFIPKIEMMPSFLFFIRPRRFGKSLFLNILAFYYDKYYENEFEDRLSKYSFFTMFWLPSFWL